MKRTRGWQLRGPFVIPLVWRETRETVRAYTGWSINGCLSVSFPAFSACRLAPTPRASRDPRQNSERYRRTELQTHEPWTKDVRCGTQTRGRAGHGKHTARGEITRRRSTRLNHTRGPLSAQLQIFLFFFFFFFFFHLSTSLSFHSCADEGTITPFSGVNLNCSIG